MDFSVWFALCRQLSRADEDQCQECQAEHENEGLLLEDIGRLLGDVRASARCAALRFEGNCQGNLICFTLLHSTMPSLVVIPPHCGAYTVELL